MNHVPYYSTSGSASGINALNKDLSLLWITLGVLFIHVIGLWMTTINSTPIEKPRQKVIVKTVQLNPKHKPLSPVSQQAPQKATVAEEKPQATPKAIPEVKQEVIEEVKIEKKEEIPAAVPIKKEEVKPEPKNEVVEQPKPKPEVIKETPKNKAVTPKKKSEPKTEVKKTTPKKVVPAKTTPAKKETAPAAKTPPKAPVKKTTPEPKKPKAEVKKEPTAEEIAAQEAEKVHQKELAAAKARKQELISKAKESVAKIGETRDKIGTAKIASLDSTSIPKQLENLQIDALPVGTNTPVELSVKEANYRDEVAYRLKSALRLPDYGSVKIKLTLDRSGRVASVSIVSSESSKNKQYVERTLPSMIFTPFGSRFGDAAQYTFMITLNNDH
ncbi:MAG: hypothetical protein H0W88_00590 [Parachlamydiaceae bacterium]|nr:hypothetical protein [Parachlamydiaceae bacterium]